MSKIVIIEDDTSLRENTLEFLTEEGYEAFAAPNGVAGVQLVLDVFPDLILCDINMPGMDGFEVLKTLQGNSSTMAIPFIFMTAKTQREEIRLGMQLGVDDYITKPFSLDELLTSVKVRISKYEKVNSSFEKKYLHLVDNANKQLEKSNAEILQLDKVKLEFLYMISQELRNPIEKIKDPIKLLKYKVENKNMAALVEIIDEAVIKLDKFSLQALEITQLKTKPQMLTNTKVLVSNLLEFALLSIQKNYNEKHINIHMKIQENLTVFGDSTLLVKCFANILDNACKFSKEEGTIDIISNEIQDQIVITITDNGIGMDNNTLSNLHKMLSSNTDQLTINAGMGLFHSKLLAEAHGGVIRISSIENEKTIVTLSFPTNI